ncbi:MAG: hypothetical protein IBJ15_14970 [Alphaproteobacteria bacterium]|nr:hypothetical protein [Alphaproteobacteria bacterium]
MHQIADFAAHIPDANPDWAVIGDRAAEELALQVRRIAQRRQDRADRIAALAGLGLVPLLDKVTRLDDAG